MNTAPHKTLSYEDCRRLEEVTVELSEAMAVVTLLRRNDPEELDAETLSCVCWGLEKKLQSAKDTMDEVLADRQQEAAAA